MDNTELRGALAHLCRERPRFREKLAREALVVKIAEQDPGYMVWQSLRTLMDRLPELIAMIQDDADELEGWQQHKITLAAEYVDAVYDSLKYSAQDDSF